MKRRFLAICLLLPLVCIAQDYRPFLPGKLHWFAIGANYALRIDSAGMIGGDSAFWMTPLALPPNPSCSQNNFTNYLPDQEGDFVDHFLLGADGGFRFVSRGGDTATFHTQRPLGSQWQFLSNNNITAQISQRTMQLVGTQMDSVLWIDLSDGSSYRLSQHYGLVQGKSLSHYLLGRPAILYDIAELPSVPDFKSYFDWQPGDQFSTVVHSNSGSGYNNYERWAVLSRIESSAGDSLSFVFRHSFAQVWYPTPDTIIFPTDTLTTVLTRASHGFLEKATYELYEEGDYYHVTQPWVTDASYNNRKTVPYITFWRGGLVDTCGYTLYGAIASPCLYPYHESYTKGIGASFLEFAIGSTITTCVAADRELLCYEQAGQDSLSPCPADFIVLNNAKPQPSANLQLRRHQSSGEWSLAWDGFRQGRYTWQIFDLQGRLLSKEEVVMDRQGNRGLTLPTSAGMYLLRVQGAAGGEAHTVRVVNGAW